MVQCGNSHLLQVYRDTNGWETIPEQQSTSESFSTSLVDVSDKGDSHFTSNLNIGRISVSISVSGFVDDTNDIYDYIASKAYNREDIICRVLTPTGYILYQGSYSIDGLERTAGLGDPEKYSLSLKSNGEFSTEVT